MLLFLETISILVLLRCVQVFPADCSGASCGYICYDGCGISSSSERIVASIDDYSNWYYCLNDIESYSTLGTYEIRAIGAYEPRSGDADEIRVNLVSCLSEGESIDFSKATILYLGNYDATSWVIQTNDVIVQNNLN